MNIYYDDIIISVIQFILGLFIYKSLYMRTSDYLNPLGCTCLIWCVVCSISSLHLSYLQQAWQLETYFIIFAFPISIYIVSLISDTNYTKVYDDNQFTIAFLFLTRFLFIVSMICALIEWRKNGGELTLLSSFESSDAKSEIQSVPVVHYGTILLPYFSVYSTFELCYRKDNTTINKIYLIFTIVSSAFYSLFFLVSRGTLIITFLGILYVINTKKKIKLWQIIIFLFAAIVGFVVIALFRIWNGSLVFAAVEGHPYISAIYSYTGLNIENLNKLVLKGPELSIMKNTFWGILQILGFSNLMNPISETEITGPFNAITACYQMYNDLWLVGVVLYPII